MKKNVSNKWLPFSAVFFMLLLVSAFSLPVMAETRVGVSENAAVSGNQTDYMTDKAETANPVVTGLQVIENQKYYVLEDGTYLLDATVVENGIKYVFNEQGICILEYSADAEGWRKDNTGWWYQKYDGSFPANTWEKIDRTWYAFDENGYLRNSGWFFLNNAWYYLSENGAMQTGWLQENGNWYYMRENGSMATGWYLDNDTYYFANESGIMQTGWIEQQGLWYFLNGNGAMQSGWIQLDGAYYYLKETGDLTVGWFQDSDTWYYADNSGAMQTGWIKQQGLWYFLSGNGAMLAGWNLLDNSWYYFSDDGVMQTGWVLLNDEWFFLSSDGQMKTGWLLSNGTWYYLYASGVMAKDTVIDGYTISADGTWENPVSSELDTLVQSIITSQTTVLMTNETKLRTCYDYLIKNCHYVRIPNTELFAGWEEAFAKEMLTNYGGNCYYYAAAFGYLARGIGYDARILTGQITAASGGYTPHAWVEIDSDGTTYLYDCEMEQAKGYDLYKKTYGSVGLTYIK